VLGPNQVGKAAIQGWRDLLAPAVATPPSRLHSTPAISSDRIWNSVNKTTNSHEINHLRAEKYFEIV
jgi:hypothetical protein